MQSACKVFFVSARDRASILTRVIIALAQAPLLLVTARGASGAIDLFAQRASVDFRRLWHRRQRGPFLGLAAWRSLVSGWLRVVTLAAFVIPAALAGYGMVLELSSLGLVRSPLWSHALRPWPGPRRQEPCLFVWLAQSLRPIQSMAGLSGVSAFRRSAGPLRFASAMTLHA